VIPTAEFERDAEEVENDFPVTFTFGGLQFTGSKDDSQIGLAMQQAGYNPRRNVRLVCRLSIFGETVPETNELITMDDKIWRIDGEPEFSSDGINVTFNLVQSI